jgi:hypothetical protein
MYPLIMGLATAFPFTIACMFAIVDVEAVIGTATGLPLIEIYYQGTGSKPVPLFSWRSLPSASLAVWLAMVRRPKTSKLISLLRTQN